jgi:molybdopterin-guanine dinucleotide biosynthesis protein A
MGRTKALLPVGGVPMAERVAQAMVSVGCAPVVLAGGDPIELAPLGRRVVPDAPPGGHGPVAGVRAALDALAETADAVVVAPCDVPDLSTAVLTTLLDAFRSARPDVAVASTTRLQPALAVWSTSCRHRVGAAVDSGTRALHQLLAGLDAVEVAVPGPLANVNTPTDLPE